MADSEQRLCRLAHDAADAEDPLRALELLVELRDELQDFTREQAEHALQAGRSYGDVARALGISRQAAHSRFRDLAPGRAPAPRARVVATERALRVLRAAREEALIAKAAAPGSEHVLMAVLRCGGDAALALARQGATLVGARACARGIVRDRDDAAAPTSELRAVLREATAIAIARGDAELDVDAVLLGALADPDGGAHQVLMALGVDAASIRSAPHAAPAPATAPDRARSVA